MHNARDVLEVLALPSQRPERMLRQGDWMLRAVPGTGDVGHVAVLASADLRAQPAFSTAGIAAESLQPGHYGLVIEAGTFPHRRAEPFARRWLDNSGRVPPHTVLLRPKYSNLDTMPDFLEDEDAGAAPAVTVHMDESQLEDWVHKALEGTHVIGSVAEIIEIFHASTAWPAIETALSWGDSALAAGAAAGETGALALIGEVAVPLGYAATIAITFLELFRAFTTGTRIQKKKGYCYGIMWEALNMKTAYKKFEPWGGDTADELRKAWDEGVNKGRSAFKTDVKLHNQVLLRIAYERLTQNRHTFTDPEARVLNLLWEQVRGSDSIGSHMVWLAGFPPGQEYDEKLDADVRVPAPPSPPH
jgi:hypothetical protein